ncbi:MAG: Aminomethyltransferase [Firmicutes bacterium ADurb.Bin080]|jgi:aminomethyltransferase|nr:MAG: Aminomethyltransferase [Firmicutes bacterium ADurb.Bin080]
MAKRTPLYDTHVALGGRIVDFAGYELPVQYETGIIAEHTAVRTKAGYFDCSHMGEFMLSGKEAEAALNHLLTNNFSGMLPGKVRYSLSCYENGGIVDDVLVYKFNDTKFMVVVNASNMEKDAAWFRANIKNYDVKFENISEKIALIAIQGPLSEEIVRKLTQEIPEKYYSFLENVDIDGVECLISRTGYTGEKGYEIYCPSKSATTIYGKVLEAGKEYGGIPCGLGARDTLRMEAGLPLYGHELSPEITAGETGLGFAIKMDKSDFIGKSAIQNHEAKYSRTGGLIIDRGIAREGSPIFSGSKEVGKVTSGTHSPTLEKSIIIVRILSEFLNASDLTVDVRGRKLKIELCSLPFYKSTKQ